MQDLIILGTGVHGGEMAHIVDRINRDRPTWNLLGHIAPKPTDQTEFAGHPILGQAEAIARYPSAMLVPDNEFPKSVALPEERLTTIIDPSSFVHPTARIGRGCVIYPSCFVGLKASIGDRVFMLSGSVVNHDNVIEDRVVFASAVTLAGYVTVEAGAYLGQSCTVRQSLRIGRNSLVGMGAVVVRDVPPSVVMVGNPARKLRDR
jgi:sugar O-acyltransferase (sialic acid O-acetyltransferase NeuD family)